MKKMATLLLAIVLWTGVAFGATIPPSPPYIIQASDCTFLTWMGAICQDTDDGIMYKWTGAALEAIAAGGVFTFLNASDTPATFVGQGGNYVKVNVGETALEFTAATVAGHSILNSTIHTDSTTGTVTRGDIITGRGVGATWTELAKGGTGAVLTADATDVVWSTYFLSGTAAATYTLPGATATIARTDAGQTFTGVQAFTAPTVATSITPDTFANATLGTGLLPFSSVFIGDAATNNVQLINTAAAGAVVLTLSSTTGTIHSSPTTTTAGQAYIGTATAGLGAWTTGTLTLGTNLVTDTGAVTLTGNVAGSTLVLPAGSLTLGSMAAATATDYITKALLTEQGDIIYASAASTPAALVHGVAGNPLISGGNAANPSWLSIVLTGGANTFNITNGTASLDVAAGAAVNIDTSLTVNTAAVTLVGDVAGTSSLTLPAGSNTLGTAAFTASTAYQAADAELAAISALTAVQGHFIIGDAAPAWTLSVYHVPIADCALNEIWKTDASGDMICAADDTAGAPAWDTIGDPTGPGSIDFITHQQTITSQLNTAGAMLTLTDTVADLTADVSIIDFGFTDSDDANAFAFRLYDTDDTGTILAKLSGLGVMTAAGFVGPLTGAVTGNASTASALAADPANCAAGSIALGVTAAGVAECTATPSGLTSVGATTFTGALTGNADTATLAATVTVVDSTDATSYVLIADSASGSLAVKTDTGLTYAADTGILTATGFAGPITGAVTGNADTATLAATVTVVDSTDATSYVAIVDSASGSLAIKTDTGITYAADTGMLTATGFTGPLTGTASLATALAANGANCSAGSFPLGVDASGAVESCTDAATQAELDAWVGSTTITTLGTIATGEWQGTVIAPIYGGTGIVTYVIGDILQANTTSSLARLANVATGNVLLSGGVGTVSAWGKVGDSHVSFTAPSLGAPTAVTMAATGTASFKAGTAGSLVGQLILYNATSGAITISPATGALGAIAIVVPAVSGTIALGSGTANYPAIWSASGNVLTSEQYLSVGRGGTGIGAGTQYGIPYWATAALMGTTAAPASTTVVLHGNNAGIPTWSAVVEADITLADNTTNNVTNAAHGFVPKATDVATHFLRADGTWATPAGAGNISGTIAASANYIVSSEGTSNTIKLSPTTVDGTTGVITIPKTDGVAGDIGLYEANSTDTHGSGFRGPASITGDGAYRGQFPNARATSANMVLAWTNGSETGTGTAADPYIQSMSFVDLDNYGLVASPTFTGVPAAPTAAADTNTTQVATTAFVLGQAGSSNPIMDGTVTVGTSLRYSRQDHIHPTNTSRAPVASPTFTGTITLPTGGTSAAPMKFVSGSLLTSPVAGSMEFLTDTLYFTTTTGPTRYSIPIGPSVGPITFTGPSAARSYALPDAAATIARTDAGQTFTGVNIFTAPTFTTSITPTAAGASTIGTATLEWGNIYLTDSAVIYGQADQTNSLTSSATGWTAALSFAIGPAVPDDVRPTFLIRGDADSDAGGDTTEALTITLTPNADPTLATWGFTSTQSAGYVFDKMTTFSGGVTGTLTGTASGNIPNTLSDAAGDLIQGSADNTWAKLTKGAEGTILRAGASLNAYSTSTFADTYVQGGLLHAATANTIAALAPGVVGSFLMSNGTGAALSYLTAGAANYVLIGAGTTTIPVWTAPTGTGSPVLADSPTFVDDITVAAAGVKLTGVNGALTILGLGDGADEDVKIDLNTTANTIIVSSPASSADTLSLSALKLVTTGTIQGGIVIDSDADGKDAAAMTAIGVRGTLFIASGNGTWILPTAVAGMSACLMDSGTSHDLILDVTTNDYIILAGTTLVQNAGITNAATATTGDFVCVVATAAGYWSTMGMSGAWVTQ